MYLTSLLIERMLDVCFRELMFIFKFRDLKSMLWNIKWKCAFFFHKIFFVLTKWSGALKNHPVNSIFMDRKSRHNCLTVLSHTYFALLILVIASSLRFCCCLLNSHIVWLKVGNSLSLNFLEARIDHGVCDEGPWEQFQHIMWKSQDCYVELLPFQITGRNSFDSHQQPSEVLPYIIFYLFTRRKLRHRWLSNLSKFILTTGEPVSWL